MPSVLETRHITEVCFSSFPFRRNHWSLTPGRNKEFRLNAIKTQILSYLGLLGKEPVINTSASNPQQMEIMRTMYERMQQSPQWPLSDTYTEKVQSFYPSFVSPSRPTTSQILELLSRLPTMGKAMSTNPSQVFSPILVSHFPGT
uniref:Uncharacterized protein n=1 Tax=Timema douglasi TaxID=61478 RepID=A0A7R8VE44_TIMDO|nr:unnamed protein product [Timema douglasi]